jgi:hypothetical protein
MSKKKKEEEIAKWNLERPSEASGAVAAADGHADPTSESKPPPALQIYTQRRCRDEGYLVDGLSELAAPSGRHRVFSATPAGASADAGGVDGGWECGVHDDLIAMPLACSAPTADEGPKHRPRDGGVRRPQLVPQGNAGA